MAELFGWEFKRKQQEQQIPSFTPKEQDDGAVVVAAGGSYGTYVDLDGVVRTEAELVTKYREMALQPECDAAIEEIINETMDIEDVDIVNINLDNVNVSERIKKAITDEFLNCKTLLDFNKHAFEIMRRWYVDGRLYYHAVIDPNDPKAGIKEVRYIDPRKIRKVREVIKKRARGDETMNTVLQKTQNEYYIFNDKGFNYGNKSVGPSTTGLRIAKDTIVHVVSGLTDTQGNMVLSYLHKAIKPLNQLRTLEDALVIYRLARAPERRVWYIDVGGLPKMKAEQYVRDIMVKHKNRLIYDAESGNIRDDRKFMTMLEDYWLPRREGGRGTEVTTLQGGQTLGQMEDVLYFQKKFLQSLNVPVSRLNSDALFSIGRATEITRDELKFGRFISRLRNRFAVLFTKMLERQVVLKQIMSIEDFQAIQQAIRYEFSKDNYFNELKDAEIISNRMNVMGLVQPYIGLYYSNNWARRYILQQSEEEIEKADEEIAEETALGKFPPNPLVQQAQQQDMMMQQQQQEMEMNGSDQQQGGAQAAKPSGDDKVQQAQKTVEQLRDVKNRSLKDEAKYKSAVQILARNK